MEHLHNLDNVVADVERAGATMYGEKSDQCWNRAKIVGFSCGEAARWLRVSKVNKVWIWPWCLNCTEFRAYLGLCTYSQIWIPTVAMVAGPAFQILWTDIKSQWETEAKKAMIILMEALCNTPVSKTLDMSDGTGQIVVGVDASIEWWGAISQQEDENEDWHACRSQWGLWIHTYIRYDMPKHEWGGLKKALKKFRNYVYAVTFLMARDADTLVHQPNLTANNLPGGLITHCIAWIKLLDCDIKHVPGC